MPGRQKTARLATSHEHDRDDKTRQCLDNESLNVATCIDDDFDVDSDDLHERTRSNVSFRDGSTSDTTKTGSLAISDACDGDLPSLKNDVDSASDPESEAESNKHEILVAFSDGAQFDPAVKFHSYAVDPNRPHNLTDYNLTIQDICNDFDYARGGQTNPLDMWLHDKTNSRNDWIRCGGTDLREGVKWRCY